MSTFRSTTTQYRWLTLLLVFALDVAGGERFNWGDSQALGGELEIKAVVPEPDKHDSPAGNILQHGTQPGTLNYSSPPAVNPAFARNAAGIGTLIRGPPAGDLDPA